MAARRRRIGLIADTHGLLRPEAAAALAGCDLIVHAGDIGSPEVVAALGRIAPVAVIRGNVDRGDWARDYPEERVVDVAGHVLYVVHDLKALDREALPAGVDAVISGHSHQPHIEHGDDGILYVNPGSAGPRRFSLPVALALITVTSEQVDAELVELPVAPPRRRLSGR